MKFLNKGSSVFLFLLVLIMLGAGLILSLRFLTGGDEDTWICQNGTWIKHGNPSRPMPSENCIQEDSSVVVSDSPEKAVNNFYSWYMKQNDQTSYKDSNYLSEELKLKIASAVSPPSTSSPYDPFYCSDKKPEGISTKLSSRSDASAIVSLVETFGSEEEIFPVGLKISGTNWRINSIDCNSVTRQKRVSSDKVSVFYANRSLAPYGNHNCSLVYPADRKIISTYDLVKTSLEELYKGPTDTEKSQGFTSIFSKDTANILKSVTIKNMTAYVNLTDIRNIIPTASSSCQSNEFLAESDETIKHAGTNDVDKVIYAIEGDPRVFYDWIKIGCNESNNNCDVTPFK
ncbi:GerMN domain-containing protein [Patescibacteria group bacterium]|nr:GerMN domain-containing protein [Patescibacteria group bacterium]MCL5797900.1 GerMN domain-containing protein [Patescibacteria group bacterium]